ncbi:microfibril-associated glycoprotein 4-like [Musca domestica]|uniref:Microfibril-associated glycoprotein 4-like n=1 Tax=Musca domestica TaxID=7370 RepID=A0ABM3V6X6_MUSDO|nr:microfibril-associated glycoprotein 4-like [Musca domestica]
MKILKIVLLLGTVFCCAKSEDIKYAENYQEIFEDVESIKNSLNLLKLKVEREVHPPKSASQNYAEREKYRNQSKPIFDIRIDELPKECQNHASPPSNCAMATACTETSGYYNITVSRYRNHTFQVFCDYRTKGGDWLHILQRIDGLENFNRPWMDYVNGFGAVDGEYWIGLENLYALTNFDGPQELYVYMHNFSGAMRYARYDHFVIGGADEKYKLKVLGKYSGNAGDSLSYSLGAAFTTFDEDNDNHTQNCATAHKGGWWYKSCARTVPTGFYHLAKYKGEFADGIYWRDWLELWNSMKHVVMMIRRQRIFED